VARERELFASPAHRGSAAYWKERLAGVAPLELATDRARPPIQTYSGRREPLALPSAVAQAFMAWARREGLTPFMALLAPLAVMLSRHAGGQTDIAIGTPVSGRHAPGYETVVGCFANTLVLRIDL